MASAMVLVAVAVDAWQQREMRRRIRAAQETQRRANKWLKLHLGKLAAAAAVLAVARLVVVARNG